VGVVGVALGFVALPLLVFAALALHDIARGEPDLRLEWVIVSLAIVVSAAALAALLAALSAAPRPAGRGGRSPSVVQAPIHGSGR
jgi:hypothetical protein